MSNIDNLLNKAIEKKLDRLIEKSFNKEFHGLIAEKLGKKIEAHFDNEFNYSHLITNRFNNFLNTKIFKDPAKYPYTLTPAIREVLLQTATAEFQKNLTPKQMREFLGDSVQIYMDNIFKNKFNPYDPDEEEY